MDEGDGSCPALEVEVVTSLLFHLKRVVDTTNLTSIGDSPTYWTTDLAVNSVRHLSLANCT